ncbi:hypothetical protein Barb6_00338 [Bacteroidales bacterium Barb6]|nr:hypothetical protein Barb6_00338 [Bacteroidales bacterium Barb6]
MIYTTLLSFQDFFDDVVLTPHSASLHVGLKYPVPLGLPHNTHYKLIYITYLYDSDWQRKERAQ